MIGYTSDSHILHTNILKYSRRPFATIEQNDRYILLQLKIAEARFSRIVYGGDLTFNIKRVEEVYGDLFNDLHLQTIVVGNHDVLKRPSYKEVYHRHFGIVVGDEKTWRDNHIIVEDVLDGKNVKVLVSHFQQRDLRGCDVNVHGHIHNNLFAVDDENRAKGKNHLEDETWTLKSPVHFNCGVDLHYYAPVDLQTLAERHRRKYDNGDGNRILV